jgi:phage tail-like protein
MADSSVRHGLHLWDLLPRHNKRSDERGELRRLIACLQSMTDVLVARIAAMPSTHEVPNADPKTVGLMLQELGNPFGNAVAPQTSRCLVLSLAELYQQKGTDPGISNAVHWLVGVRVRRIDCYNLRDDGEAPQIGVGASTAYSFDVICDQSITQQQRHRIRAVIEFMKPPHTHLIKILPDAGLTGVSHE